MLEKIGGGIHLWSLLDILVANFFLRLLQSLVLNYQTVSVVFVFSAQSLFVLVYTHGVVFEGSGNC